MVTFSPIEPSPGEPNALTSLTVNLDIVAPNDDANTVSIPLGQGNGTFGSALAFVVGTRPYNVAIDAFSGVGLDMYCDVNRRE